MCACVSFCFLFFVFVFADFCLNLVNEENGDSVFMGKVFILHGRVKDIKALLCGNEAHARVLCLYGGIMVRALANGSSGPDVLWQDSLLPQDPYPPRCMKEYRRIETL